jgi:hypothetical protein
LATRSARFSYNCAAVPWFYRVILVAVLLFGACVGLSYWGAAKGYPAVAVFIDFVIRAAIWGGVAAFAGAVMVLLVFMWRNERELRQRLASSPCPHCGRLVGNDAAVEALRRGLPDDRPLERHEMAVLVSMHRVTCPSCRGTSYFYPDTGVLSVERSSVLGIPESSRALPADIVGPRARDQRL